MLQVRCEDQPVPEGLTAYLASYDAAGRLLSAESLPFTLADCGIDFSGTISGMDTKLFLLDSEMVPMMEACPAE